MDFLILLAVASIAIALFAWWRRSVPDIRVPARQNKPEAPPPTAETDSKPNVAAPKPIPLVSIQIERRTDKAPHRTGYIPEYLIQYADTDGVVTTRQVAIISRSWNDDGFRAWCFLRSDERSFRYDRILSARNMRTGRGISDLRKYVMRNW